MIWTHIEITSGLVSGPVRNYCGNLVGLDFSAIGHRLFFVEAIEPDGGRIGVYDSVSYAAALAEAESLARSEDLPVRDMAGGAA